MSNPHNKIFYGVTKKRLEHIDHQGHQMTKHGIIAALPYTIDYGGCQRGRYRVYNGITQDVAVGTLVTDAMNALRELEEAYELVVGQPYKFKDALSKMTPDGRSHFVREVQAIWSSE